MKTVVHAIAIAGVFFIVILFCGCASTSPKSPVPASVPLTPVIPSPTPTHEPFPNALSLNTASTFGPADMTGQVMVTKYMIKPNYNWTSPSWNSPREQAAASPPLTLQRGYNMEKPHEGTTFLFVFIRLVNTGSKAIYAPSPQQFVINGDGEVYSFRSVSGADVTIDGVLERQYDYLIGKGGTGGYVQPGESNKVEGYLIYEVPAALSPEKMYLVGNLDYQTRAVWKLT